MAETIEGVVQDADDKSFKVNNKWLKYSKRANPPHVNTGQNVRVEYVPSEYEGKTYLWANKITVLPSANGVSGTPPPREDGITWANSINAAVECLKVHGEAISPNDVLTFAEALYSARPWAEPEEPVTAEPAEPAP